MCNMRFLTKRCEYTAFSRTDLRIRTRRFVVLCRFDAEQSSFSVGLTISKKVGCAVQRNRMKRRIKAYLRHAQYEGPAGWQANIIAYAQSGTIDWDTLSQEMNDITRQLTGLAGRAK